MGLPADAAHPQPYRVRSKLCIHRVRASDVRRDARHCALNECPDYFFTLRQKRDPTKHKISNAPCSRTLLPCIFTLLHKMPSCAAIQIRNVVFQVYKAHPVTPNISPAGLECFSTVNQDDLHFGHQLCYRSNIAPVVARDEAHFTPPA